MAFIKLSVSELEDARTQMSSAAQKTKECSSSVAQIRNSLDMQVSGRKNIEDKLTAIGSSLDRHSEMLSSYAETINDVINGFVDADKLNEPYSAQSINASFSVAGAVSTALGWFEKGGLINGTGEMYRWVQKRELLKVANISSLFIVPPDYISSYGEVIKDYLVDSYSDAQEVAKALDERLEKAKSEMTSSQAAWVELIIGKAKKLLLSDKAENIAEAAELTQLIIKGDYMGALEKIGEDGVTEIVEGYAETIGYKKPELEAYIKYGINVFQGGAAGVTELILDPSIKNVGNLAWGVTGQPILDTAGEYIEDVIKLIPGISEYYFDEHGAEDIGDCANIMLGDLYSLFTGDEGMREYASTYYEDGLWDGMWRGGEEIVSFIKDSGGAVEAGKRFFETAAKDGGESVEHIKENVEILYGEAKEYVDNVSDFIEESGGSVAKAAERLIITGTNDAVDAVKDTASRVWHSFFDTGKQ